jgi:hypothetical protein
MNRLPEMRRLVVLGLVCAVAHVSCGTPPPRPWLRFQPAGATNWAKGPDGLFVGQLHGADVSVDLGKRQTRVEVVVANSGNKAVEFRMGPEGAAPRSAIGEVLLRPLGGVPGASGPDMLAYNCMQSVTVEPGWRGSFYLDAPLGREPKLGQYFVLTVEARADGQWERRNLPLVAVNSGTMPADGQ